ncbi:DUF3389 family protein [Vibrio parahaemolyticus]|nr:DUF3389 family protein [Vibrio parahaemolyticus]
MVIEFSLGKIIATQREIVIKHLPLHICTFS